MAKDNVHPFKPARIADTARSTASSATASFQSASDTGGTDTFVAASPSALGQTMTLQNLGGGKVLVHPLYMLVCQVGGEWHATSADLALVGIGESDLEAVDDLRDQVRELYEELAEMRQTLGPHLLEQLAFLDRLAGVTS